MPERVAHAANAGDAEVNHHFGALVFRQAINLVDVVGLEPVNLAALAPRDASPCGYVVGRAGAGF